MYIRQKNRYGSGLGVYTKTAVDPITGATVTYECSRSKPDPARRGYTIPASDSDITAQEGCSLTRDSQSLLRSGTGTSAGEVLTGVGAILAALTPAVTGVIQTQAEASAARRALKRERQQQVPAYNGPMQPQIVQQGPSTGLILGIAGGFAAIALILILVLKK